MKKKFYPYILSTMLVAGSCSPIVQKNTTMDTTTTKEEITDHKLVIYQMMVRLFGNKNTNNKFYGSRDENGVGKFNDVTDKALDELKKLGISHVWYTGILEHATMTDYTSFGIKMDDPDIVKGIAGSPYAIKDYYDVDPDLAVSVPNRMTEFESLVSRTHNHGMKLLIDFIPNHVARTYNSDSKPAGVADFGENDDKSKAFDPMNDFYYLPGKAFVVPQGTNAGGDGFNHPMKDGRFDENPARVTGNNVFSESPSLNDWSETIKLNYGVDNQGNQNHFDPIPPVWNKMRDILIFWANKNVDGFRCDVAEMVPVEFWNWVIPEVKKVKPEIIFIAEAYNPQEYQKFLTVGKFDYLYDKVGLYDGLKRLIKNEDHADVKDITHVWSVESKGFSSRMVRFLENHDEERIASTGFAQNPWLAKPAMVISATLSSSPVMIYFGQEVGEPAHQAEGFGGEDNRTTIFDYWGVPNHQKWMNNGAFDGAGLNSDQNELRNFYKTLLNIIRIDNPLRTGEFLELTDQQNFSNRNYAYLRFTNNQQTLVIANFDREKILDTTISFPDEFLIRMKGIKTNNFQFRNLLTGETFTIRDLSRGIPVMVKPSDAWILSF
ncbi:alpha-amylase family protein [Daejeonella oryzae]|uniref:alpha-amylase family protein n=1 Tax=Daejeonella oryzae TaxID=1122943 RepID=UPI000426A1F9|nr:alpha-amylase family protein [Daejeonella oryzae]